MDVAARFREYVQLDRLRKEGGLSPAELHRWRVLKQFLTKHFSPAVDPEKDTRDSVRVPTQVKVSFATDGDLASSMMTNMSRHGVFVQTPHPLELKTRFDLHLHVEEPARDIVVPVEVVSIGIGPNFERRAQGMGLRFLDTKPEVTKQLEELYERSVG